MYFGCVRALPGRRGRNRKSCRSVLFRREGVRGERAEEAVSGQDGEIDSGLCH